MKKVSGAWGASLIVAVSPAAQSQALEEKAAVPELSVIEVQGHVAEQLPIGSSRITRYELESRQIESWDDLGRRGDAGVTFNRGTDSVNVRGMDRDRVVTRVDGIRLPWLTDGARGEQGGLSAIDFRSLSSIDLVRGSGAPASGSLTGYLDLHTLQPDDLLPPGQDFGSLLKTGYDSSDESWDGHVALAGRMPNGSTKWLVQAGLRRGHELENKGGNAGYGPTREARNPEHFRQHNLLLKLQHDINTEHKLLLSGESFSLRREIDNRLEQGAGTAYLEGANATNSELQRQRAWMGYEFRSRAPQAALEYADLKLYWQESELESYQNAVRRLDARGGVSFGPFPVGRIYGYAYPFGPYGRNNSVRERSHGVISEWGGTLGDDTWRHRWAMGMEWYSSRSEQGSSGYDNCPSALLPVPPRYSLGPRNCEFLHTNQADVAWAKGNVYAVWLQDEISWGGGRYAVEPALRYDHYSYRPEADGEFQDNSNIGVADLSTSSGGRFSPSMMLKFRPAQDVMAYARYGYGFKAPNSTQLYMNYGAPGTYLRVGNPNLRPEVSRGWELGVEYGDSRRGLQLALFDNRYRDFIDEDVPLTSASPEWNPAWDGMYPMGVTAFANRSRVRIYGAELSGQWDFNQKWYSWGSIAWARGRDQDSREYINSVAPLRAILGVGYRQKQWGADAVATLVRRRDEVADPDNDFKAPGFGLLDLSAWWAPQEVKALTIRAGIYNVFDKKYWSALNVRPGNSRSSAPIDYYTEPGRSFRISLSYQY